MNYGLTELLVTVFGSMTALFSYLGGRHARIARKHGETVSDSVNHTHATGEPRIYDLALQNRKLIQEVASKLEAHIDPHEDCKLRGCLRTEQAEENEK